MATNQQRKTRQRRSILAAATKLFMRDGYKATRVKAVADEAGVSQVTLYKYFDSKLALGRQAAVGLVTSGYARFQKFVDNSDLTFPELLQKMMGTKVSIATAMHPDFFTFVTHEMQGQTGSNEVKQAYEDGKTAFWESVIARGRQAGMINPDLSSEALMLYLNMYVQYISNAQMSSGEYKKIVEQLMHLFFYGFVGVPATPHAPTKEDK